MRPRNDVRTMDWKEMWRQRGEGGHYEYGTQKCMIDDFDISLRYALEVTNVDLLSFSTRYKNAPVI